MWGYRREDTHTNVQHSEHHIASYISIMFSAKWLATSNPDSM